MVAPLVGAWIEIQVLSRTIFSVRVAPLVGAWIEIGKSNRHLRHHTVAPLVGAWIEINVTICASGKSRRRSPCGSVD